MAYLWLELKLASMLAAAAAILCLVMFQTSRGRSAWWGVLGVIPPLGIIGYMTLLTLAKDLVEEDDEIAIGEMDRWPLSWLNRKISPAIARGQLAQVRRERELFERTVVADAPTIRREIEDYLNDPMGLTDGAWRLFHLSACDAALFAKVLASYLSDEGNWNAATNGGTEAPAMLTRLLVLVRYSSEPTMVPIAQRVLELCGDRDEAYSASLKIIAAAIDETSWPVLRPHLVPSRLRPWSNHDLLETLAVRIAHWQDPPPEVLEDIYQRCIPMVGTCTVTRDDGALLVLWKIDSTRTVAVLEELLKGDPDLQVVGAILRSLRARNRVLEPTLVVPHVLKALSRIEAADDEHLTNLTTEKRVVDEGFSMLASSSHPDCMTLFERGLRYHSNETVVSISANGLLRRRGFDVTYLMRSFTDLNEDEKRLTCRLRALKTLDRIVCREGFHYLFESGQTRVYHDAYAAAREISDRPLLNVLERVAERFGSGGIPTDAVAGTEAVRRLSEWPAYSFDDEDDAYCDLSMPAVYRQYLYILLHEDIFRNLPPSAPT